MLHRPLCLLFIFLLVSCGGGPPGRASADSSRSQTGIPADSYNPHRYTLKQDKAPDSPTDTSGIADAVPRIEPVTKAGNKNPYTVLGKTYYLVQDPRGFSQKGKASWYGTKFHGHKTSNGETYNMYAMSAAHKTLPIPCYVRVTNLDNGKTAIVRVNDRGPFHDGRIIDLSYAAAKKLDYQSSGTANVEITYIDPANFHGENDTAVASSFSAIEVNESPDAFENDTEQNYHFPSNTYLQVGAFSSPDSAENLRVLLSGLTDYPVSVKRGGALYKVRIGPITDNYGLLDITLILLSRDMAKPHVIFD
ncbi:MAG: septal ring lytic transglycosylase RlpA family protein [Pseudomonadales bacterium]|nr:septal ring lytic transglycosylase RlpA family protein [Pseudomonadales bacterium]